MGRLKLAIIVIAGLAVVVGVTQYSSTQAQAPSALTGQVSSAAEGAMEGVLVSAKKADSNITITVVSDKNGRYTFPANRLDAGQYTLRIRAVGYDLDGSDKVEITARKSATRDLKLQKTEDLRHNMSNAEWMAASRTDQQKIQLLNCVGCHTLSA